MRVCVVGAGYVGLTTSICLAELGHDVICADIDRKRIVDLVQGLLPLREDGLIDLLKRNTLCGRLRFSEEPADAVGDREVVLIAVGTPRGVNGEADMSFVCGAAADIASAIAPNTVVALKSTVAVGTARAIREVIAERRGALDFKVASNPEFLREGSAVRDFMEPDRVVIGADDQEAAARLVELYRPLLDKGVPVVETGTVNAELIKYAANAFLALRLGFINDVADLCENIDGDIGAVVKGIGLDHRIGGSFLKPGPGYGGSCFPKDTEAFTAIGRQYGAPQPLVETLITRNSSRKHNIAKRIISELKGIQDAEVAILGVAFKANTDDVREAPALEIIPSLQRAGIQVRTFDPWVNGKGADLFPNIAWSENPYEAAEGAHLLVILTEWDMFRKLDLSRLSRIMRLRAIFDCRNLFDPAEMAKSGFRYICLGRAVVPRSLTEGRARTGMLLRGRSGRNSAKLLHAT
jgi:UDPglucose 6-dehydrogenase